MDYFLLLLDDPAQLTTAATGDAVGSGAAFATVSSVMVTSGTTTADVAPEVDLATFGVGTSPPAVDATDADAADPAVLRNHDRPFDFAA
jgi:hypothetical protein